VVKEGSRATRHPVRDLNLPSTVTLGGMMRNGVGSLINGMTQLQAGDTVMAFCIEGSINKLGKYFN
jgi:potassium uptake protein trkA